MAYFPPTGSVVAFQANPSVLQATVNVTNLPTTQNISGSVAAWLQSNNGSVITIQGTSPWVISGTTSLVSTVPSSVIVGASIFGLVPVNITNTNVNVSGSVAAFLMNTVRTNDTSVISLGQGSIAAALVSGSILGTYAEDVGHATGDKGLLTLVVRNDAVASFVGADLDYSPIAADSAGRTVVKHFAPDEARIIGNASTVAFGDSGSVLLVAAAGAGLRNYVTDFMVSNTGSVATGVVFTDGSGSILGQTIAPTGGGSNKSFFTPIRTAENSPLNVYARTQVSVLYATVYGYKAP